MSFTYKIRLLNIPEVGNNTIIYIKPPTFGLEAYKKEIFDRLPKLKDAELDMCYEDSYGDTVDIYDESDFDLYGDYYYDAIMCISERRSAVPSAVATPEAPATPARTNQK